jgi:hypothetical protein
MTAGGITQGDSARAGLTDDPWLCLREHARLCPSVPAAAGGTNGFQEAPAGVTFGRWWLQKALFSQGERCLQ